jgi:23S rRNA-intervening sequence protein
MRDYTKIEAWRLVDDLAVSVYEHTRRGSLAETQYFVHLARRLNYLSSEEADALAKQTKLTFACLQI